jgi:hypothetical protein
MPIDWLWRRHRRTSVLQMTSWTRVLGFCFSRLAFVNGARAQAPLSLSTMWLEDDVRLCNLNLIRSVISESEVLAREHEWWDDRTSRTMDGIAHQILDLWFDDGKKWSE